MSVHRELLVKDDVVVNIIVVDGCSKFKTDAAAFCSAFTALHCASKFDPEPQIGWTWNGTGFDPPIPDEPATP